MDFYMKKRLVENGAWSSRLLKFKELLSWRGEGRQKWVEGGELSLAWSSSSGLGTDTWWALPEVFSTSHDWEDTRRWAGTASHTSGHSEQSAIVYSGLYGQHHVPMGTLWVSLLNPPQGEEEGHTGGLLSLHCPYWFSPLGPHSHSLNNLELTTMSPNPWKYIKTGPGFWRWAASGLGPLLAISSTFA